MDLVPQKTIKVTFPVCLPHQVGYQISVVCGQSEMEVKLFRLKSSPGKDYLFHKIVDYAMYIMYLSIRK